MLKYLYAIFLCIFLTGCTITQSDTSESKTTAAQTEAQSSNDVASDTTQPEVSSLQTGYTKAVPAEYKSSAEHSGTVNTFTYDSYDYAGNGAAVTKEALVYTPYGYDESDTQTMYNVLYLMHGWGGFAGDIFTYSNTVQILDHMIENGEIEPLIVVAGTFYNDNSSKDFSESVEELRAFHRDFEENLMPAVEGVYHTYAQTTTPEGLKASRDHRAFGGFSLGSVTTWQIFCYDYDYVSYFLPMSGSSWYYGGYGDFQIEKNVDFIQQLVEENNLTEKGYFIYQAVGTEDTVKSQTYDMAEEMLTRNTVFTSDHYVFYEKDGGIHDYNAAQEFIYNALPLFFKSSSERVLGDMTKYYVQATKFPG